MESQRDEETVSETDRPRLQGAGDQRASTNLFLGMKEVVFRGGSTLFILAAVTFGFVAISDAVAKADLLNTVFDVGAACVCAGTGFAIFLYTRKYASEPEAGELQPTLRGR